MQFCAISIDFLLRRFHLKLYCIEACHYHCHHLYMISIFCGKYCTEAATLGQNQ